MTKQQALEVIADGHTFWKVEFAREVCKTFGIPFNTRLVLHYEGQKDANPHNEPKGLWLSEDKPIDGVSATALSDYVAMKVLGVERPPSSGYIGRGFGSQANANAVKFHLHL